MATSQDAADQPRPDKPIAEFSFTGRWSYKLCYGLGIVLMVLGGLCSLGAMVRMLWLGENAHAVVTLSALAALPGVLGLVLFLRAWLRRHRRVYILPNGFAWTDGRDKGYIAWPDIREVRQEVTRHSVNGIPTGTTHKYALTLSDGSRRVFGDRWPGIGELGDTIDEQSTRLLLPEAVRRFSEGETVAFGPLALSREGIQFKGEALPWEEVKDMNLSAGFVTISKEGKWLRWANLAVSQIPNVQTFLTLAGQAMGTRSDRPPCPSQGSPG